jgi:transcriptional regulator with XRE-family HTH domain
MHKTAEPLGSEDDLGLHGLNELPTGRAISRMKKPSNTIAKSQGFKTRQRQPTEADSQVGASIRAHRLMARMSQDGLAGRLGVTFQQIQKYEKGTNRVGAGRLPLIAEILNVPINAFFSGLAIGASGAVPTKLVTDTASVRLLTAFQEITDSAVRRNLSELAERVAASAKKKARR